MLPASNRGAGNNVCFPDVCKVPAPPAPFIPTPLPDLGMNAMSMPMNMNVLVSAMPAMNMACQKVLTTGDEAGAMGGLITGAIKGNGATMVGNPIVQINALPAENLLCPNTGNNMNAPLGAQLVPSVTNVFYCSRIDPVELLHGGRPLLRAWRSGRVGYLTLTRLAHAAGAAVRGGLQTLRAAGCTRFVLDLRGNPGGALDAAVDVAGLFLPLGARVARLDGRVLRTAANPLEPRAPLALRVDRGTASAAEVLAAALAEHGRAALTGEATYGKGLARTRCGRTAFVTTSRGAGLHGVGVSPTLARWEACL